MEYKHEQYSSEKIYIYRDKEGEKSVNVIFNSFDSIQSFIAFKTIDFW